MEISKLYSTNAYNNVPSSLIATIHSTLGVQSMNLEIRNKMIHGARCWSPSLFLLARHITPQDTVSPRFSILGD